MTDNPDHECQCMMLTDDEMNDLVTIFVESNDDLTEAEAARFLSWANHSRFMATTLELVLAREVVVTLDADGELCFSNAPATEPRP